MVPVAPAFHTSSPCFPPDALSLRPQSRIQRKIEIEHVDPWLAKQTEKSPGDMLVNKGTYRSLAHATRLRNPWNLIVGGGNRDIGVQPRRRRRHQINRNRRSRWH